MMSSMMRQVLPFTSPTTFITSATFMFQRRFNLLRKKPRPLHAACIGRNHNQIGQLELVEVAHQHRAGEEVVDWDVEEALNLGGVQVNEKRAIGACGGQQVGDELGAYRHA